MDQGKAPSMTSKDSISAATPPINSSNSRGALIPFSCSSPSDSSFSFGDGSIASAPLLPHAHLLEGRTILVAEDSDDMWRVTQIFLHRAGAEADRTANGKEAVEKASEHDYSAILMDMQMPVMDGLEATRQLRANGCESPILAFTTNPRREHAMESLGAGCDEHLTKPLSGQKLVQKIADYCVAMDEESSRRNLARQKALSNP